MRILKLVLLSLLFFPSTKAQLSFNIKGGLNFSDTKISLDENVSLKSKYKLGYHFGATAEYLFKKEISVESGLIFFSKNIKIPIEDSWFPDITVNMTSLQLPSYIVYKHEISPKLKFVLRAGPYIAYNFSGKLVKQLKDSKTEKMEEQKENLFKNENENSIRPVLKRFDAGIGMGLGFEYENIGIEIHFDKGLQNLAKSKIAKIKDSKFYLSIAYNFSIK